VDGARCAGQCDSGRRREPDGDAAKGDLKARCRYGVADEPVGKAEGWSIDRTGPADAEMGVAGSAKILHRR
jgi:hypothetical protein